MADGEILQELLGEEFGWPFEPLGIHEFDEALDMHAPPEPFIPVDRDSLIGPQAVQPGGDGLFGFGCGYGIGVGIGLGPGCGRVNGATGWGLGAVRGGGGGGGSRKLWASGAASGTECDLAGGIRRLVHILIVFAAYPVINSILSVPNF